MMRSKCLAWFSHIIYKVSTKPTLWKTLAFPRGTSATSVQTLFGRFHSVFFATKRIDLRPRGGGAGARHREQKALAVGSSDCSFSRRSLAFSTA